MESSQGGRDGIIFVNNNACNLTVRILIRRGRSVEQLAMGPNHRGKCFYWSLYDATLRVEHASMSTQFNVI